MAKKPHLKLNTKRQADSVTTLKFNYGKVEETQKKDADYRPLARKLKACLTRYYRAKQNRIDQRNDSLKVPDHIDYIQILFQSQFSLTDYYQAWNSDFGLFGVKFSKFNHEVLFAVIDNELFKEFIKNIELFFENEYRGNGKVDYSGKVKYIKEFKLLSTEDILEYSEHGDLMNFYLTDFPLGEAEEITNALIVYLNERGLRYRFIEETKHLEVYEANEETTLEIVRNFDIVHSVTSSLSTVVRPNVYNQTERTYGFEIENHQDNLPLIGILDTGISHTTPLAPIIINDDSFNLTTTSVFDDNANGGSGHGTGVAALAALGRNAYYKGYKGQLSSDAQLLSIKILDSNSGFLSHKAVVDLLYRAKEKYPDIKIFVLTVCYNDYKRSNSDYSLYAYELDKFSYENDCLVVISTSNNNDAVNANNKYNLDYFNAEVTNISSPAESMNNLVVGAAADSLRNSPFEGISDSKEFPTMYSRKSHIDLHSLFTPNKINKFHFKPDVIECGGDYEYWKGFIGTGEKASMEILSAKPNEGFYTCVGTSYSAPLVANIAAQIQKNYPSISAQSIKALIINGASNKLIRFPNAHKKLLTKTSGHGFVNPDKSIFSDENTITFIIEENIAPEDVKIFPLFFPEYLSMTDLGKRNRIVQVSATLCYSFEPLLNQHLAYCPLNIAFGIYKNQTGEEILRSENIENGGIKSKFKLDTGWTHYARYKQRPIPYSNTQKMEFCINVDDLLNESNTFKLAVNCRVCPQLIAGTDSPYNKDHNFSIVITVEETLKREYTKGQLYAEMESLNEVENIAGIDIEALAEGDA